MRERTAREDTAEGLQGCLRAWNKAPTHVKVMAGGYVDPILHVVTALNREIENLTKDVEVLKAHRYGH